VLQFIAEFLGHFHPVVVHLPIGILLIAALFHFLTGTARYQALRPAVSLTLVIGMITAVIACITGLLLSSTGDYDADIAGTHQWLGIATAIVAFVICIVERKKSKYLSGLIVFMVVMLTFTGHLGGTLTHGEGYLTESFYNDSFSDEKIKPIANVQDAQVYGDVIQPILATKCYGCHGTRKQKGGLRLDQKDFILKGGDDGSVIAPGDAGASELVHRIYLADEDDDHMPPKQKPQLTAAQKDLIKWWIESGAPFDKKVQDVDQSPGISNVLAALSKSEVEPKVSTSVPEAPVDEAPQDVLAKLRKGGVVVIPVGKDSHYLSVNFVNADVANDSLLLNLSSIDKQIVWLKTGSYPVRSEGLKIISELTALTRLQIGNLQDSQNELQHLGNLKNLQYLNLTGTEITKESVDRFRNLTALRNLYLFNCRISPSHYSDLKTFLPNAKIDTGRYQVPTFASDTTEVTAATK
jgi:uncharacterized membrane protein/Leucine-rich repeat (LRR) protein